MVKKKRVECYCNTCRMPFFSDFDVKYRCPFCANTNCVFVVSETEFAEGAKKFEWNDTKVRNLAKRCMRKANYTTTDGVDEIISDFKTECLQPKKYPRGILLFKNDNTCYVDYVPRDCTEFAYNEFCAFYFGQGMKIYSVENSSGELLSIGDETNFGVIEYFRMAHGMIEVDCEEGTHHLRDMNDVHPKKKIIYPQGILSVSTGVAIPVIYPVTGSTDRYYQDVLTDLFGNGCKIHSVKNSCSEVLTIGDHTTAGIIHTFKVWKEEILVGASEILQFQQVPNINDVHPKKKVFRTEDGYELKDREPHFMVCVPDYEIQSVMHDQGELESRGIPPWMHCFKHKSNAETFIDHNKPLYSKGELMVAMGKAGLVGHKFLDILQKKVT